MRSFKLSEKLFQIATLPNPFYSVRLNGDIEEPLIALSVLNNRRCLPFYGQNHRPFMLLELLPGTVRTRAEKSLKSEYLW